MTTNLLSQRELEVFELVVEGLTNDEIAARLSISRRTVETHLRTVFHKTGVTRRTQLVALARPTDGSNNGTAPDIAASPQVRDVLATASPRQDVDSPRAMRRLDLYSGAVRRLVDRQFPLFEERVEITVTVGDHDGQDTIHERRWTTPKPYVVYRILGPIVANTGAPPCDPDQLEIACDVLGQDIHADVSPVQDADGLPLVIVLFQPGLASATEWTLRYRSPGLWGPLREAGQDTLKWATATRDRRHPPTLSELTLRVVFPAGWTGERVTEQSGSGSAETERLSAGQTQVTWQHGAPVAGAYSWMLEGRPS
jgi:DNA-binding CsgD family transcriptional regulator